MSDIQRWKEEKPLDYEEAVGEINQGNSIEAVYLFKNWLTTQGITKEITCDYCKVTEKVSEFDVDDKYFRYLDGIDASSSNYIHIHRACLKAYLVDSIKQIGK